MAPEIVLCKYKGTEADIFACGDILFIIYSGTPPFQRALVTDPFYKTIKDKNYGPFWDAHKKNKPVDFFTDDFKDLFQSMVAYKPE
jgi:serine/threonine protein kinase